jgi:hypothetical protein
LTTTVRYGLAIVVGGRYEPDHGTGSFGAASLGVLVFGFAGVAELATPVLVVDRFAVGVAGGKELDDRARSFRARY